MEQTVAERPLPKEPHFNQLQSWHNGTMDSNGAHSQQNLSQTFYPRRSTGWNGPNMPAGIKQDKAHMPICRNNIQGSCTRGVSCKFRHSEFVQNDRSRYCRDEQQNSGPVTDPENAKSCGQNKDGDAGRMSSSREFRNRSPCRNFLRGSCLRGSSCRYLHSEYTNYDILVYDRNAEQHHRGRVDLRDPGFDDGNVNNLRTSQGLDESNEKNDLRIVSFPRERRSRSPCRNFLKGRCRFGASCRCLHVLGTYVRPGHDLSAQLHRGVIANQHNDLRIGSFSREPRSRSPCRNFLSGKCFRGSSCLHLHPVTRYEGIRYDWGTQQHQGVKATSRNLHFGEQNVGMGLRMSHDHEHGMRFSEDSYVRNVSVNDVAVSEHNHARRMNEQLTCNRGNVAVAARSWSFERNGSRPASDFIGEQRRPEVCLKFTKGRCERGESCKYLHGYHEYASSITQQSRKSHLEAATNQSALTMVAQEHDTVGNKRQLMEGKHNGSRLVSTDGCFHEEIKGQSMNDAAKADIFDQMGDATGMDRHKCGVSAEENKDINLLSRPLKRQRSRSRSPCTPGDNFRRRRLRQASSNINFSGSRSYNVAQFQYPDRRSFKHVRPANHMNNQHHSKAAATSANLSSCEDGDANVMVPQGLDEVVSHEMQLDQSPSSSLVSDSAISSEDNEHESATDALSASHAEQKLEKPVSDSIAVEISEAPTSINQEAAESNIKNSGEEHHVSKVLTDMPVVELPEKGKMAVSSSQKGNENSEELTQVVEKKRGKSRQKRRATSKSRARAKMDEVTDTPSQRLPFTSTGETTMSHPSVVSDSKVSDEININTGRVNILENVLVNKLPIDQNVNGDLTGKLLGIVDPSHATVQDVTFPDGDANPDSLQAAGAASPNCKRKLLVLDVNGLLADIVADFPDRFTPDITVSGKGVFKRPFCDTFLEFCFERFDVGIWSSRNKKNVDRVVDFLMKDNRKRLLFCWDQSHCTQTGFKTVENKEKPLVLKELKKLWEQKKRLPWEKGYYNETNTILLDDSPYKALRNPPYTAIFPHPYSFRTVRDNSLGRRGDLRLYLERLAEAENVQKFIQENPFGQRPITKSNCSWTFYAKIVGTDASQKEGNANASPVTHGTKL